MTDKQINGGLVVVLEGIDGVGKTTQIELARKELEAKGWPVEVKRNLGDTPIGEALRDVMKSPLERPAQTDMYISAAIQEALIGVIAASRAQGRIVLMDRGPLSLAAYAIYGGGVPQEVGWPYVERGLQAIKPELTIIYEADIDASLGHLKQKADRPDYFESQPHDYFERVASGYKEAAKRYPDTTVLVDANQPIQEVHGLTMQHIQRLLDSKLTAA